MLILKVLSVAALVGSVAWFIHAPDYEPAIAALTSLSASVATFLVDRKRQRADSMHQAVSSGAVGIQARGDVRTGDINTKSSER